MTNERRSTLALLKYPLVFFGLSLLVVEAAFGTILATRNLSFWLVVILSSWMGVLFLVSIITVAILVYKVPSHIMLESQKEITEQKYELDLINRQLNKARELLERANYQSPDRVNLSDSNDKMKL